MKFKFKFSANRSGLSMETFRFSSVHILRYILNMNPRGARFLTVPVNTEYFLHARLLAATVLSPKPTEESFFGKTPGGEDSRGGGQGYSRGVSLAKTSH